MKDPAILRERAKVKFVPDEELGKLMPHRQSIVEVTLTDGQMFREHVDSVRGTASNPMTSDEIKDKARDLMAPILGDSTTAQLIDSIFNIEKVTDMRQMRKLLQKTARGN
jgi:2-methylcitrate dehydratase PrpD